MAGIQEALKGGGGAKALEESRVGVETKAVETLLEEIAKDGKFAYGPEVEAAAEAGGGGAPPITEFAGRRGEGGRGMRPPGQAPAEGGVRRKHPRTGEEVRALPGRAA